MTPRPPGSKSALVTHAARWGRVIGMAFLVARAALTPSARALAAPSHKVVLVRPVLADPVALEVLSRVRGELLAAGFDVLTTDAPADAKPRDLVETAAASVLPVGAFALVLEYAGGDVSAAELWVADRREGRTMVERTRLDSTSAGRRAAVLAVRAAELLRVSLAAHWTLTPTPSAPEAPRPADAPAARAAWRDPPGPLMARESDQSPTHGAISGQRPWRLQLGVGTLPRAVARGWAWQSVFGAGFVPGPAWEMRLEIEAPGRAARISGPGGSAEVTLLAASLGGARLFRAGEPLRPFLQARAGTMLIAVHGQGAALYQDRAPRAWTAVGQLGVGCSVRLSARLAWRTAMEVWLAWPRVDVRVGQPSGDAVAWPAARLSTALEISL